MKIANWNLGNRTGVGKTLRLETADAANALRADVIVVTEFFPNHHEDQFRAKLKNAGWCEQPISAQPPTERANRVLVASKLPLEPMGLVLPTFDEQFPANLPGFRVPSLGLSVLAVRVPWYKNNKVKKTLHLVHPAWDWLEAAMTLLRSSPSLVIGDLNVTARSRRNRGGDHFRRILESGWQRASGGTTVTEAEGFLFAGPGAISDHAALVCRVERRPQ